MSYHPSEEEPPEWRGRGREWPTYGGATRGGPVGHRDTGEMRRIRAEQAREAERARRQEDDDFRRDVAPATALIVRHDGLERFALWLCIFREILVILALLVFLFVSGFAVTHGGWPVWILGA